VNGRDARRRILTAQATASGRRIAGSVRGRHKARGWAHFRESAARLAGKEAWTADSASLVDE